MNIKVYIGIQWKVLSISSIHRFLITQQLLCPSLIHTHASTLFCSIFPLFSLNKKILEILIKKKNHYLFFGCIGSSFLCGLFSSCSQQGLLPSCGAQASHCSGFSCCWAWAPGHGGFRSCASQGLEYSLNSCGACAQLL